MSSIRSSAQPSFLLLGLMLSLLMSLSDADGMRALKPKTTKAPVIKSTKAPTVTKSAKSTSSQPSSQPSVGEVTCAEGEVGLKIIFNGDANSATQNSYYVIVWEETGFVPVFARGTYGLSSVFDDAPAEVKHTMVSSTFYDEELICVTEGSCPWFDYNEENEGGLSSDDYYISVQYGDEDPIIKRGATAWPFVLDPEGCD